MGMPHSAKENGIQRPIRYNLETPAAQVQGQTLHDVEPQAEWGHSVSSPAPRMDF